MKRYKLSRKLLKPKKKKAKAKKSPPIKPTAKVAVKKEPTKKQKAMKELNEKLGIDDFFTESDVKPKKKFNKVKQNIPPLEDANHQCDLLKLPLTKKGFGYCLVVVDLWSDEFDIEPIQVNPKAKEGVTSLKALEALKKIYKRKHLKLPKKMASDNGSEFKKHFHTYLFDKNVFHQYAQPYRHQQQANVERLNRTLGKLFWGYLNAKRIELKNDTYSEWTDIVPTLRQSLNAIRKRAEQDPFTKEYKQPDIRIDQVFKVGDLVHRKLFYPRDVVFGQKFNTDKFREGDLRYEPVARKIVKVLPYPLPQPYRYMLEGINNVSYADWELKKSRDTVAKYEIQKLLDKKKLNGRVHYLVKWKGFDDSNNEWISLKQLKEDEQQSHVYNYEKQAKKK